MTSINITNMDSNLEKEYQIDGGRLKNLSIPIGLMLFTNNHNQMQKYAIDLNSSRTMVLKDPLYDTLLDKVKSKSKNV